MKTNDIARIPFSLLVLTYASIVSAQIPDTISVQPLVGTHWGQGGVTNSPCSWYLPQGAVAGSGPVALAQIVAYYDVLNGLPVEKRSLQYPVTIVENGMTSTRSTSLKWEDGWEKTRLPWRVVETVPDMPSNVPALEYNGYHYFFGNQLFVGKLLQTCGALLHATYDLDNGTTTTSIESIQSVLTNDFAFLGATVKTISSAGENATQTSLANALSTIETELSKQRPVVLELSGSVGGRIASHFVIADGCGKTGSTTYTHLNLCGRSGGEQWVRLDTAPMSITVDGIVFSSIRKILFDIRPQFWMSIDDYIRQAMGIIPDSMLEQMRAMMASQYSTIEQTFISAIPAAAFASYGFTNRSVIIEWRPYTQGATYTISRCTQTPPDGALQNDTVTLTTTASGIAWVDESAQPGVLYHYTVVRNSDGQELGCETASCIHVLPPGSLTGEKTAAGVELEWSPSDGASWHTIYWSGPWGTMEEAAAAPLVERITFHDGTISTWADSTATISGMFYRYAVRAFSNCSGYSFGQVPTRVVGDSFSLSILGSDIVVPGGYEDYSCLASYVGGVKRSVSPLWTITSGANLGSINDSGRFQPRDTEGTVTIRASYGEESATKTISVDHRNLVSLFIAGPKTIHIGGTAQYACCAVYEGGVTNKVMPSWSLPIGSGSENIGSSGTLSSGDLSTPRTVTIRAIYNGLTSEFQIDVLPITPVSGTISENTTWSGHGIYHVTAPFTVNQGTTLTIDPGVIVKFDPDTSLTVNGTLNALGTRAKPIVFTSIRDDEHGGDTNEDGNTTYPQSGDWARIYAGGTLNMNNCIIRYCNNDHDNGAIHGTGGTVTFDNSVIEYSVYECVRMNSGRFTAHNSVFRESSMGFGYFGGSGVYVYNCVVADCTTACRASNKHFYNTVFYRCNDDFLESTASTCDHCVFYNPPGYGKQSAPQVGANGNVWGDPLFTDPDNGDFRIAENSPCVDAGNTENAPERDYYGQRRYGAPDIGIYEVPGASAPTPDLAVTSVTVEPLALTVGEDATITWTVKNVGQEPANGQWCDGIDIVAANGRAFPMEVFYTPDKTEMAPGETKTFSATRRVPAAPEGSVLVRVTVNNNKYLAEPRSLDNNVGFAEATLSVPTLNVPSNGSSMPIQIPAESDEGFSLGGGDVLSTQGGVLMVRGAGELAAWLGDGTLAAQDNALRTAVQIADDTWLLQIPVETNPRVTIANDGLQDAIALLSLKAGGFFLYGAGEGAAATTAANSGTIAVPFAGNGFSDGMEVWIERDGVRIDATEIMVDDAVFARALFDVSGAAAGDWTLHVRHGGTESSAALLTLTHPTVGPKWWCKVNVSATLRANRVYAGNVEYGNSGDTAMPAPYLHLTSNEGTLIRLDEADAWTDSIELMAISSVYPASSLKPGESGRVEFFYKMSGSSARIECGATMASAKAFPWDTNAAYMRPSWASDEMWDLALATLKSNVGMTWDGFLGRMRANCDHLMKIGQPTARLDRIWQMEVNEALGVDFAIQTLAGGTDLARVGRGFGLSFTRTYGASMSSRFKSGVLGYGWTDNYYSYAELIDQTTLAFHLPSGATYQFFKVEGKWSPEDDRDKTVLAETDVAYVLTNRSGTVQTVAKSNMRTSSIRDNQGNQLTFTYDGTRLREVRHTDGQSLTFAYNADGKLSSVTDDQGRTAHYAYKNGLLRSVTAFNGLVTRYVYHAADATPLSRALTQIVYPDGTTKDYTYDAQGRVATISVNGNKFTTEIVRKLCGSYSIVAPNGGETEVTVGAMGETLRTVNALGQVVQQKFTEDALLESVIAPSGRRNKIAYNKDGMPVSSMSASGATTTFGYEPDFDNLASVTDAKGHAIDYGYDDLGRGESISYADGSSSALEYNVKGDVTWVTNRRGETIEYEYDPQGNLVKKTWPDGRTFTLVYDAKGNVTNAADSVTGAVTMEYDANERLTRIVYPKNRGFTYAYDDVGRVTERAMLGGTGFVPSAAATQRYTYDSLGRLSRVTDGDGSLYLENAYDPTTGWLVTQTYGNGTVVSNAYDILGRTTGIYHSRPRSMSAQLEMFAFFEYAYDEDGRCVSQATDEGVETYTYDADGQLTAVTYPDGTSETFAYDAVGNRLGYTVNELNQYLSCNGATFTYDADGNMTSRTDTDGTTTYCYDVLNRLVAVTNETKNVRWSCEYDVFGNRVSVTDNGVTTERVFVQGSLPSVAAEYVDGTLSTRHILVGAVRLASGGAGGSTANTRYYHADLLGSTRLLTDGTGATKGSRSFKAFGETRVTTGETTAAGYVGTLGIETDPTGLLFMRNRYYDAGMGRFVQMDPIGLQGRDVNMYRYCGNCPLSNVDFTGLETATCTPVTAKPGSREYSTSLALGIFSPYWGEDEFGIFHFGMSFGLGFGIVQTDAPFKAAPQRISMSMGGAFVKGGAYTFSAASDECSVSRTFGFGWNLGVNFDLSDIAADLISMFLY